MKYREESKGIKQKSGSKNNLQHGAFGVCHNQFPKEIKVKEQKIVKATPKGAIPSVYVPYKTKKNKYTPNSKGKVKTNV